MHQVERTALLPYPAPALFDIVNDVARYPEFLPWCKAVRILEASETEVVAELTLRIKGISETMKTRNRLMPHNRIELELVSGPLKHLEGLWCFTGLGGELGCRVELSLDFQLEGAFALLGRAFGGVLARSADRLVDAFCERAHDLHGA